MVESKNIKLTSIKQLKSLPRCEVAVLNFKSRLNSFKSYLSSKGIEVALIVSHENIQYMTGFYTTTYPPKDAYLIVPVDDDPLLVVPSVDYHEARREAKLGSVEKLPQGTTFMEFLKRALKNSKLKGAVGVEAEFLPYGFVQRLKRYLKTKRIANVSEGLKRIRSVKDLEELSLMKRAVAAAEKGLEKALEAIKVGVKEFEVAAEAEYAMRKRGGQGVAFDTIVASGPLSAYPHAASTDRVIQRGDFVVVDIGARFLGYRSDVTRTFVVGSASAKHRRLYEVVLEAQRRALSAIKSGVRASKPDKEARDYMSRKGLGERFTHGLGHGIGLSVHEPPTMSPTSTDTLKEGNVVTVEPGVYEEGFGGVRIEDMVYVKSEGLELLTSFEKDLRVLI